MTSHLAAAESELSSEKAYRHTLEMARGGDLSAFREVVEGHKQRVYAVAIKLLGEQTLAEEATQETFVRLYRSFKHYDSSRRFFTYLYRITANVCCDLAKREHRYRQRMHTGDTLDIIPQLVSSSTPETELERREISTIVRRLVQRLGIQQRTTFVLRDVEGLEVAEIAKILRCRQGTVRSHLHHARRALRGMLEEEYPDLI